MTLPSINHSETNHGDAQAGRQSRSVSERSGHRYRWFEPLGSGTQDRGRSAGAGIRHDDRRSERDGRLAAGVRCRYGGTRIDRSLLDTGIRGAGAARPGGVAWRRAADEIRALAPKRCARLSVAAEADEAW